MKRIVALILMLVMCLPISLMTSCKDPLKEKMEELDQTYIDMGNAYTDAIYWTSLAGVYEAEDIKAVFNNFKIVMKDAKTVKDAAINLTEEEMDAYIEEWKGITAQIQVFIDEYKVEEETSAEATSAQAAE